MNYLSTEAAAKRKGCTRGAITMAVARGHLKPAAAIINSSGRVVGWGFTEKCIDSWHPRQYKNRR